MLNNETVKQIIEKIKLKIKPKIIYIFGSYAYGIPNNNSDLDILIIKDFFNDKKKELIELEKALLSSSYSVDIILLTETEYQKKLNEGWRLFKDIEKKGIKISA